MTYGLQQCKVFVLGSPNLIIATDHKPLTRILNDRSLESIENPRLLRIKEKTLPYSFKIIHIPGDTNMAPDATSRYPAKTSRAVSCQDDEDDETEIEELVRSFAVHHSSELPGSISWKDVDYESNLDDEVAELRTVMEQGFPTTRNELPERLRSYYQMRDDLYLVDNVVFRGKKMLIPKKLRQRFLEGLHAAHQGVNGMKANARERFFWLGLDSDIKQKRDQCRTCNENAPSQKDEPMILTPPQRCRSSK